MQGRYLIEGFLAGDKADINQLLPYLLCQGVGIHAEPLWDCPCPSNSSDPVIGYGDKEHNKGLLPDGLSDQC